MATRSHTLYHPTNPNIRSRQVLHVLVGKKLFSCQLHIAEEYSLSACTFFNTRSFLLSTCPSRYVADFAVDSSPHIKL